MSIRRFEEAFMKGLVAAVWFGLLAAPAFAQQAPPAPGIQNAPEIPFESVPFLKLTPERNLGEVLGVAVNSKGHVVVFNHPGSAGAGPVYGESTTQIMEFDEFFFSSSRRHTRLTCDWSSDVCSSD